MKIEMVDLKGQYDKIKAEVDAGIQEVIDTTAFIKGGKIKEFEEALAQELHVNHVIACANGTDALQIAMMALNLQPGDEVIVPVFTYVATAEVIALLGLIPVMVDVDPDTFCIDPNKIEALITTKTKAIVPVHLFGQCANMNEVMRIAKKHDLFVVEDTAQAIGATYNYELKNNYELGTNNYELERDPNNSAKTNSYGFIVHSSDPAGMEEKTNSSEFIVHSSKLSAGTIGDIGTTSFFPSKNLGCYGDGGALFTNDDQLAKKIRMICNHGQSVQYLHDVIGVNSRLDTIQAAVLLAKLPHLRSYEKARQEAAARYDELLKDVKEIELPYRDPKSTHVFHQYTITVKGSEGAERGNTANFRDQLKAKLAERGIPSMVYYPIELHKQKAFEKYWDGITNYPVSAQLCKTVLSLPMHTELTAEMQEYIAKNLKESILELKPQSKA